MFQKFYWKILNFRYCLNCHKMTPHKQTSFGQSSLCCKDCHYTKLDLKYNDILDRIKAGKNVTSNDPYIKDFIVFVKDNYYNSGSLFLTHEDDDIIEDEDEIYDHFLDCKYDEAKELREKNFKSDIILLEIVSVVLILTILLLFIIK